MHNDAASFVCLLSHCAEADRCFQAQLMPVGSPEPAGCSVGCQRLFFPSRKVGNIPSDS